jgi:FMN phosphatase YigB (HAD superfamily)
VSRLAPRAVAVYGIGVVAREVLQLLHGFNVVGLMDKDPANGGKTVYGATVLTNADVIQKYVDTIVIAASDVYWDTIATRIAGLCRPTGIRVLFPNGQLACIDEVEGPEQKLLIHSRDELTRAISDHDVISFDLFETLVTRFASRPDDILELAMMQAAREFGAAQDYISLRKQAESLCSSTYGRYLFDLSAIYTMLVRQYGLEPSIAARLQELEEVTEIALAVPRRGIVDMISACRKRGKQVCITTDTHLPRRVIESVLSHCSIPRDLPLFISCEVGASKLSGDLFDVVKTRYPNRSILHIGDHPVADGSSPREHGIHPFRIYSCGDTLSHSRLKRLLVHGRTTHDGVLLGMVSRSLFDGAEDSEEPARVSSFRQFGYIFFGPVVLAWMVWLTNRLRRYPAVRLLFLAREGYLLSQIYNTLRRDCHLEGLPEGIYFPTSRRMAVVASLRTPEDAKALLNDAFSGAPEELLRLRYGLADTRAADDGTITNKDPEALQLVEEYMDRILANAEDERDCYAAWMRGIGVVPEARIALADLGIKGTIQHALQRVLNTEMAGCYITGFFGEMNPYGMSHNTAALFPNSPLGNDSDVYRYHLLWESVLVAPEGMYLRTNPDGTFVNAPPRKNQKLFDRKSEIHSGIEAFVSDWLSTGIGLEDTTLSSDLVDALFGVSVSNAVDLHDSIKSILYVDESYRNDSEKRIFD